MPFADQTDAPHLPINNSAVKNVLRPVGVSRGNWLHPGSDRGGRTAAAKREGLLGELKAMSDGNL